MYSINCRPFNTNIQFTIHTIEDFPTLLPDRDLLPKGKALIVVDPSLPNSLILSIRRLFDHLDYQLQTMTLDLKSGKSIEALLPLWKAMTDFSPQLTVGVGGGTICDLVGFATASYKRGSPYMLFPTTTLAMVDACVSGKTGIDFQGVKNIIGAIHYPLSVINVLSFLDSISEADFRSGFAEIVKIGVVASPDLIIQVQQWIRASTSELRNKLAALVSHACSVKAEILAEPAPNRAKPLYGHIVGEAIELSGSVYRRHGDCVAIGMAAEGLLACRLGIWNLPEWEEQMRMLRSLELPTTFPAKLSLDQIIEGLERDKYATQEDIRFVFPQSIGCIARSGDSFFTHISRNKIRQVLEPVYIELLARN